MPALKKWFDKSLLKVGDGENELSLFALTFPIFMGHVSSHLNAIVQTAMCSRYAGGLFVIPVSIVGSVFNVLNQVAALVAIGVAIVLSIYLGRKDHETCKKNCRYGSYLFFGSYPLGNRFGIAFCSAFIAVYGYEQARLQYVYAVRLGVLLLPRG